MTTETIRSYIFPRIVLTTACLVTVGGLWLFIFAESFYTASIGRFLIGFGSAFAYISTLKIASIWLPRKRFAMVAGLTTSLGMAAAIFSEHYLIYFGETIGYKQGLFYALIAGLVLSGLIFFIVRNRPKSNGSNSYLDGEIPSTTFKE